MTDYLDQSRGERCDQKLISLYCTSFFLYALKIRTKIQTANNKIQYKKVIRKINWASTIFLQTKRLKRQEIFARDGLTWQKIVQFFTQHLEKKDQPAATRELKNILQAAKHIGTGFISLAWFENDPSWSLQYIALYKLISFCDQTNQLLLV